MSGYCVTTNRSMFDQKDGLKHKLSSHLALDKILKKPNNIDYPVNQIELLKCPSQALLSPRSNITRICHTW